jgi:phosphodiesterase/alkaline phosphatase D-like protein
MMPSPCGWRASTSHPPLRARSSRRVGADRACCMANLAERWTEDAYHSPRIRVTGLQSRQTYSFTLQVQGTPLKTANVTTLPAELPAVGEKPFTVLLGSCFAHHEDRELRVGKAFFHMPCAATPDIKLLSGDQVYLDSPWYRYLLPHSLGELSRRIRGTLEHYCRT